MLPAVGRSHGQASEVGRGKGGGWRGGEGRLSGRRRFPILLARSGSVVAPEKGFVSEFHVGWRSLGRFVDADCSPRILCPIAFGGCIACMPACETVEYVGCCMVTLHGV